MNSVQDVKKWIAKGGIAAVFVDTHRDIELLWRHEFTGHESVFVHFFSAENKRCEILFDEYVETHNVDIGDIKKSGREIKRFYFPPLVNGVPAAIEKAGLFARIVEAMK